MNISSALEILAPGAMFSVAGDSYSGITWFSDDITQPTEAAVNAKIAELVDAEPLRLLRIERDKLLRETDWWASSDLTMSQEQKDYRQALRDLPEQATAVGVANVEYPTKPT